MRVTSLAAILALCLLCSCGTILNGGPFMVPVDSYPPGATVHYKNSPVGTTPCQVAMYPTDTELRFTLPGWDTATANAELGTNWWGVCNGFLLIPGFLVGVAVDLATGGAWVVDTGPVSVHLVKSYSPPRNVVVADRRTPGQAATPIVGDSLRLSSRSKLHGQVVAVEKVEGKIVTVRAVDSGETDAIEVPFVHDVDAAKLALEKKAKLPLNCLYQ